MIKYVLFVHGKTSPSLDQIFEAVTNTLPKHQYVLDRFTAKFPEFEKDCAQKGDSSCFMHTPVSTIAEALREQIETKRRELPADTEIIFVGKSAGGIPLAMLQRKFCLANKIAYLGSAIVASDVSTVDTYAARNMYDGWVGRIIRAHNGESILPPTFSSNELSRTPTLFLHGEFDDDAHNGDRTINPNYEKYEGNTGYSFLRQNSLSLARQVILNWTVREIQQADHSFRLTIGPKPKQLSPIFLEEFVGWLAAK